MFLNNCNSLYYNLSFNKQINYYFIRIKKDAYRPKIFILSKNKKKHPCGASSSIGAGEENRTLTVSLEG